MTATESTPAPATARSRWTSTLFLGLAYLLALEILLFSDVTLSHRGAVHGNEEISRLRAAVSPNAYGQLARFVAVKFTPRVWPGYVVLLDGLLVLLPPRLWFILQP